MILALGILAGLLLGTIIEVVMLQLLVREQRRYINDLQDRLQASSLSEYKAHVAMPAWENAEQEWFHSATGSGLVVEPAE